MRHNLRHTIELWARPERGIILLAALFTSSCSCANRSGQEEMRAAIPKQPATQTAGMGDMALDQALDRIRDYAQLSRLQKVANLKLKGCEWKIRFVRCCVGGGYDAQTSRLIMLTEMPIQSLEITYIGLSEGSLIVASNHQLYNPQEVGIDELTGGGPDTKAEYLVDLPLSKDFQSVLVRNLKGVYGLGNQLRASGSFDGSIVMLVDIEHNGGIVRTVSVNGEGQITPGEHVSPAEDVTSKVSIIFGAALKVARDPTIDVGKLGLGEP